MRLFELTISVYLSDLTPIPETFNGWVELAGLRVEGASPTTLERLKELRYPLAHDVVGFRRKYGTSVSY